MWLTGRTMTGGRALLMTHDYGREWAQKTLPADSTRPRDGRVSTSGSLRSSSMGTDCRPCTTEPEVLVESLVHSSGARCVWLVSGSERPLSAPVRLRGGGCLEDLESGE